MAHIKKQQKNNIELLLANRTNKGSSQQADEVFVELASPCRSRATGLRSLYVANKKAPQLRGFFIVRGAYALLTFTACGPFMPSATSKVTLSPSLMSSKLTF